MIESCIARKKGVGTKEGKGGSVFMSLAKSLLQFQKRQRKKKSLITVGRRQNIFAYP